MIDRGGRHERQRDGQRVRARQLGHDLLLALHLRHSHARPDAREQTQFLVPVFGAAFRHDSGASSDDQDRAVQEEELFFAKSTKQIVAAVQK